MKSAIEETLATQVYNHFRKQQQLDNSVRTEEGSASSEIETTDGELHIFDYCRRRLAFLARQDAGLFENIEHVGYKDLTSKVVLFYMNKNSEMIFEFYEGDDVRDYFFFEEGLGEFELGDDLTPLDQPLLTIFKTRVRELADS